MFDAAPLAPLHALPQSGQFVRALGVLGISTHRLDIGARQGSAVVQSRILPVLGQVGLISRGPVWQAAPEPELLRQALSELGFPCVVNAVAGQGGIMRRAGLVQVMTPATLAVLDLSGGSGAIRARMHGKWRNRLRRAEASGMRVRSTVLPGKRGDWAFQAESVQRRARGYRGLPPDLARAYGQANPGEALLYEGLLGGAPAAAMVILRHGAMATYHLGVTTDAGRTAHAHNLILWRAAQDLAAQGCLKLDLGLLDTEHAPGLARFKLGSGARAERLGGSWLYTRGLARLRALRGGF